MTSRPSTPSTTTTAPLSNLLSSTGTLHPNSSSTSLITPQISSLSDPPLHSIDSHFFDLFINESIQQLIKSDRIERKRRDRELHQVEQDLSRLGINSSTSNRSIEKPTNASERERDEAVKNRLDQMGYRVGWTTAERLTRDRPRFPSTTTTTTTTTSTTTTNTPPQSDPLELVKFICKDLWVSLFDKQVDNLRTNHRGVYVLLDNSVRSLERLSGESSDVKERERVLRWSRFILAFPAGVIRGALANLGLQATVIAECTNVPQASFQIKTTR